MHRMIGALCAATMLTLTEATAQERIQGRTIANVPSAEIHDPALSPDGRWVIYAENASNTVNRVMIRPVAGGAARELKVGRGENFGYRFTAQGDRVVFLSSVPRRSDDDNQYYLVSAPFDSRTGNLTAPERQIALEPVRREARLMPAISPDGKSVAYVSCCASNELKVVPISGGNARTLVVAKDPRSLLVPGWLSWSADSRFVMYHRRTGDTSEYMKVSVGGGDPSLVTRFAGGMGPVTPDQRHFFSVTPATSGVQGAVITVKDLNGRELRRVLVPMSRDFSWTADGKYLVGRDDKTTATIKVASVTGGPIRTIGSGAGYEWPDFWERDSRSINFTAFEGAKKFKIRRSLDGREVARAEVPSNGNAIGIVSGWLVWDTAQQSNANTTTMFARNVATGVQRELAKDVISSGRCCSIGVLGGGYSGISGSEFYVRQLRGDRLHLLAMQATGETRLLAELPQSVLGVPGLAVFENRVVFAETAADSVRLRVSTAPGRAPVTLATMPIAANPGVAWSHDGRQLSVRRDDQPQMLRIFRFDANGAVQGPPRELTLPFDYFYDTYWLPDGSGMTMIAQPKGSGTAEVALVRFADPGNPVLITKADAGNKWGHALSPNGQLVAYPSETIEGGAIYAIELAELLKSAVPRR